VLVVIGVLVSIAVPSYLGAKSRAADTAAKANIRAALPAVHAFAADNVGASGDADNKAGTSGLQGNDRGPAAVEVRCWDLGQPRRRLREDHDGAVPPEGHRAGPVWSALVPGISSQSFKASKNCT
jgi:type II secretory pathway pseudopilin PulG